MAVLKKNVVAAGQAANLTAPETAAAWSAVVAARAATRAVAPLPPAAVRQLAEISAAVGAVPTEKANVFSAALIAAAPVATPAAAPVATPVPTPAPAQYADAVERALIAAGVPEAQRPVRIGHFADAIATGRGLNEALTRLLEGLNPYASELGRARFAGLTEPWWKRGSDKALGLVTTWQGRAQLGLLLLAMLLLWQAPVEHRGWFIFGLVGVIVINLRFEDRKVLLTINLAFAGMIMLAIFFGITRSEWVFK